MVSEAAELAGRLRGLRRFRGLSQNELARLSGVAKPLIATIEGGRGLASVRRPLSSSRLPSTCPASVFGVGDPTLRRKYWYFEYARDYHVAASRNAEENFSVVAGVLAHHAVEMYLKALLLASTTEKERKEDIGHNLFEAWTRGKLHLNLAWPDDLDVVIRRLDRFEEIRYPEEIERRGLDLYVARRGAGDIPDWTTGSYVVAIDDLDRVAQLAVEAAGVNPDVLRAHLSHTARQHWI